MQDSPGHRFMTSVLIEGSELGALPWVALWKESEANRFCEEIDPKGHGKNWATRPTLVTHQALGFPDDLRVNMEELGPAAPNYMKGNYVKVWCEKSNGQSAVSHDS